MTRGYALAALALPLLATGCGGNGARVSRHAPAGHSAPSAPAGDVALIRRWANTLRAGDVDGAARLFRVPATVANGSAPERLTTRAEVRAFNASLPCGARLLRTRRKGGYTVATFVLTERRGGDCGSGVGSTAATAFVVYRGKILEWLRVPTGEGTPSGPAPDTSTS